MRWMRGYWYQRERRKQNTHNTTPSIQNTYMNCPAMVPPTIIPRSFFSLTYISQYGSAVGSKFGIADTLM
jgi:hypothetical protein